MITLRSLILLAALAFAGTQLAAAASLADLLGQLNTSAAASGDATLKSLATDLGTKATRLNTSLGTNAAAQGQLQSAVQALTTGNGSGSLGMLTKLTQAQLTPDQMKLAKEVGNIGGAYVVQRNFSSLDGAQGDVAQIVNSLRKGQPTAALPALQKVGQNAALTAPQKELLGSLADQYAPSARKLGNSLESGLKSLPGLGK